MRSALLIVFIAALCASGCSNEPPAQQIAVAGEPAAASQVALPLPSEIERALNTDPAVLDCFARAGTEPIVLRRAWFSVTRLDASEARPPLLQVRAVEPCLRGEFGRLWFYQNVDGVYRLHSQGQETAIDTATRQAQPVVSTALPAVLPDALHGRWLPRSAAFYQYEPLVIEHDKLSIDTCEAIAYRVLESGPREVLVKVDDATDCAVLDAAQSVLRLALGKNDCELALTTYANVAAAQSEALSAWGVFVRPDCP